MYIGRHVKCPLLLSDFKESRIFWTDFRKIFKSNFIKIRPVGAELFNAGGRMNIQRDRNRQADRQT
jgi:hypothetical protein